MVSPEEREDIIAAAVERALLRLPYAMGSLIDTHFAVLKANKKFYSDHKEFADHKDVVASTVEEIDNQFPLLPYDEKLSKAIPEIRKRIDTMISMNLLDVKTPSRNTTLVPRNDRSNGEL